MKTIDFSHTGGFPLDTDVLDFMQTGYMELTEALFADIPTGTPVAISGMQKSYSPATGFSITDGWMYYNGRLYKVTGATYGNTVSVGSQECITLAHTTGTAIFEDASTPVTFHTYSAIAQMAVADASNLPLNSLKTWHEYLATRGQAEWSTLTVGAYIPSGSQANGTLYWRQNNWTKQLELIGSINVTLAQNIVLNNYYVQSAILPGVTIKTQTAFPCLLRYHNNMIYDQNGGQLLQLNADLYNSGSDTALNIGFMRPDTVTSYTIFINTTAPLA